MAAFLGNLRNVVIAGFVLALLLFVMHAQLSGWQFDWIGPDGFGAFVLRWLHVISGVMWIGLLWYFNFVSTPTTPSIPAELRPALGKYITPAALWWFRWGAMSTIVFGILLAGMNRYIVQAYTLDFVRPMAGEGFNMRYLMIGIGMWLGTIMWFNVWFVIWPNQQKALSLNPAYASLDAAAKTAAGGTAGRFSRINTLLSIPMLFCMVAAMHWP
jgi:uncharacterized membrane protein